MSAPSEKALPSEANPLPPHERRKTPPRQRGRAARRDVERRLDTRVRDSVSASAVRAIAPILVTAPVRERALARPVGQNIEL